MIIVDIERLKDFESGLGQFCYHLKNNLSDDIHFLASKKSKQNFVKEAKVTYINPLHRLNLALPKAKVWHSTHQDSRFFPFSQDCRIILTIHDLNFIHQRKEQKGRIENYLKLLQGKVNRSDHIVFISNYSRNDAIKYLTLDEKKTSVIYNGISFSKETEKIPVFKNKIHKSFLFNINKFLPKKNLLCLVKMMKHLPELQLVLAGDNETSYGSEVKSLVASLNLDDQVILCGKILEGEKKWLYKNCEAFCFPSLLEGFGLPVVEAHAYGKKTIVSRSTSLPEVAGGCSYFFEGHDPEDMAGVVKNALLDNSFSSDDIKKNSERFNWALTASSYEKIYRQLS